MSSHVVELEVPIPPGRRRALVAEPSGDISLTVCVVGGRDYEPAAIVDYLQKRPAGTRVVTGSSRGLETFVAEQARRLGLEVFVPRLRPECFDYYGARKQLVRQALDLQVGEVFTQALKGGTLVLVGAGTRVRRARVILKRANWPLKVVEL